MTVPSTMRGTDSSEVTFDIALKSATSSCGLVMLSRKTARVFSSMARRTSAGADMSTYLTSSPHGLRVFSNNDKVFPNRCLLVTMLVPAPARVSITLDMAAMPEETAIAAAPPLIRRIRCSKSSTVGLVMRE